MARIFICYSREDTWFLESLIQLLQNSFQEHVLWTDEQLVAGEDWWEQILAEIARCDLFLYLLSNDSLESLYCQAEFREALRLRKRCLSIKARRSTEIENAPADLRKILRNLQWVEMWDGRKDTRAYVALRSAISKHLSEPPRSLPPLSDEPTPAPEKRQRRRKKSSLSRKEILTLIGFAVTIFAALLNAVGNLGPPVVPIVLTSLAPATHIATATAAIADTPSLGVMPIENATPMLTPSPTLQSTETLSQHLSATSVLHLTGEFATTAAQATLIGGLTRNALMRDQQIQASQLALTATYESQATSIARTQIISEVLATSTAHAAAVTESAVRLVTQDSYRYATGTTVALREMATATAGRRATEHAIEYATATSVALGEMATATVVRRATENAIEYATATAVAQREVATSIAANSAATQLAVNLESQASASRASTNQSASVHVDITRIDASAVSHTVLVASVSDQTGQSILGLGIEDFELFGALAGPADVLNVVNVASEELSYSVVLAIDVSSSMTGLPMERTIEAAQQFVDAISPEASVAIYTFSNQFRLLQDFTTDKAILRTKIGAIQVGGATGLYQAAYDAIQLASNAPTAIRAVILLSDGANYGVDTTAPEAAVNEGRIRGIPIYTIGLGYGIDRSYLRRLSEATNARFFESPSADELGEIYANLAHTLQSQYIITAEFPFGLADTDAIGLRVITPLGQGFDTTWLST